MPFFAGTRPVAPENRCLEDFLEGHLFRCYVSMDFSGSCKGW